MTTPDGARTTYLYNEENLLSRIKYADSVVVRYTYDANGNRIERKMKTGQRPRLFMMPLEEWWKSTGKKDSTMPIGMTGKEISSRRRMPLEIGYPWNTMETEI